MAISLQKLASGALQCDNGVGAYSAAKGCDKVMDCADGSDEAAKYCSPDCGTPYLPWAEGPFSNRISGGTNAFYRRIARQNKTVHAVLTNQLKDTQTEFKAVHENKGRQLL